MTRPRRTDTANLLALRTAASRVVDSIGDLRSGTGTIDEVLGALFVLEVILPFTEPVDQTPCTMGRRILAASRAQGISLDQLRKELGFDEGKIELAIYEGEMTEEELARLAARLQVSTAWLEFGERSRPKLATVTDRKRAAVVLPFPNKKRR